MVNPANPFVVRAQVACAAHELPLTHDDERWFGDGLDDAVRDLVLDDQLKPRAGRMYWAGRRAAGRARRAAQRVVGRVPARRRATGGSSARSTARGVPRRASGRDLPAPGPAVPGRALDTDDHVAVLEPADDADEYTQPREETDIAVVRDDERVDAVGVGVAHLGAVTVTHTSSRTSAAGRRPTR